MKNYTNQKGMSSILFAMIFAIILSLLAVGFATLVRKDQRQTIDQSLGYQAQYAAETAVNQVAAMIKESPTPPADNPNCDSAYNVVNGSDVKVTCVTWDDTPNNAEYQNVGKTPVSTLIQTTTPYDNLYITWNIDVPNPNKYPGSGLFPNTIQGGYYSVIRFTFYSLASGTTKQFYFVPSTGLGTDRISYSAADGSLAGANCNNSNGVDPNRWCSMEIIDMASSPGYIAIAALGDKASRLVIAARAGNAAQELTGSQYSVDATAVAQDVTKRVNARVSYQDHTWRPGYTASANTICKDIKIDGATNASAAPGSASATSCP